jgi:DNA invertase Pin-like site-specific DNA recombinase
MIDAIRAQQRVASRVDYHKRKHWKIPPELDLEIRQRLKAGQSVDEVAEACDVHPTTVKRRR